MLSIFAAKLIYSLKRYRVSFIYLILFFLSNINQPNKKGLFGYVFKELDVTKLQLEEK